MIGKETVLIKETVRRLDVVSNPARRKPRARWTEGIAGVSKAEELGRCGREQTKYQEVLGE